MTIRAKPASSKALLLLPVLLVLLCVFYLPTLRAHLTPTPGSAPPTPASQVRNSTSHPAQPRGTISALLHAQNLSHGAFHNRETKPYLADLVSRHHGSKSVVIIGYAFGGEARLLPEYDVQAIEPMPHFIEKFRKTGPKHVTLHPFAAGKEAGKLEVSYNGVSVVVNMTRGEDVLPEGMAPSVVSADTQGSEYDALLGLGGVLERAGSVWVEVGCRDSLEGMLRWLDKEFVLFDFVPWGKRRGVDEAFAKEQFAIGDRPQEIGEWVKWFCERKNEFQWLQTDLVGVKRSIVGEVWKGLAEVGERCCASRCALRDIMKAEEE